MGIISAKKIEELSRVAADGPEAAKKSLIREVGDISELEILGDNLLVATYIGSEKTKGGLYRAPESIKEDEYQGNIGLVVKVGEGLIFDESDLESPLHEWVLFGYNDGLRLHYNDVPCRIISMGRIRAIIPDPTKVL